MSKDHYIWPIGITLLLLLFIGFLLSAVFISQRSPVNLADRNYYYNSVNYQQQMESRERGMLQQNRIDWIYDAETQSMTLHTAAAIENATIHFRRPSDERMDYQFALQFGEAGKQTVPLGHLAGGLWWMEIEWTAADGSACLMEDNLTIEKP